MELTEAQYDRIKDVLPVQRGNVRIDNLQVLNAVLYVAEQNCGWRGLPRRFGRWHTVYTRINRWSKNGVLNRVFQRLHAEQIIPIQMEATNLNHDPRRDGSTNLAAHLIVANHHASGSSRTST